MSLPPLFRAWKGKSRKWNLTLTQANGSTAVNVESGDIITLKLGRTGKAAALTVASDGAGDSTITTTVGQNTATLLLHEDDLGSSGNLYPGVWDAELLFYDASEDITNVIDRGSFVLHDTNEADS